MIPGPIHYYSGGTFLAANSKTRYPNAAKEVVRYLTCDDDFLEKWALERGDFTSNNYVNQKIKDQFAEPYLNGQNHWAMFSELAPFINGTTTQGTDGVINGMFHEALTAYIKGEKTKDKAVADFKAAVTSELGL
jgi:ABC-type glycerol-3-phosphate transport system substrate-binding protein